MSYRNLFRFLGLSLLGAIVLFSIARLAGKSKDIKSSIQGNKEQHYTLPEPDTLAAPMLAVKGAEKAVKLSDLQITTTIQNSIAVTRYEMTFYNQELRALEAELNFPLAEGQSIRYFAMEVNGEMRPAVAVEKQKARVAFESTVRRNVDPGLVEMTAGNNFKARVYPVPPKGKKRIILEYIEDIKAAGTTGFYFLPLFFKEKLNHLSWYVNVTDAEKNCFPYSKDLRFEKVGKVWTAKLKLKNVRPRSMKRIGIKNKATSSVSSVTRDGKTQYFQARFFVNDRQKHKIKPRFVTVYWDVSGSRAAQNCMREKAVLKAYISYLKNVTVEVIPFANTILERKSFLVQNGETKEIMDFIETLPYDGGTNLNLPFSGAKGSELLVFSDGLSNLSWDIAKVTKKRIYTLTSVPSSDFSFLQFLATLSGGQFLNLNQLSVRQALGFLKADKWQFIGFAEKEKSLEYYPVNAIVQNGSVSVSGKASKGIQHLTALFGYGNHVVEKRRIDLNCVGVTNKNNGTEILLAMKKIQFLSGNYRKNKKEITDLGLKYRLVTQNTSLLVLDAVEDYVEHEIVPPHSLQRDYFRLLKEKQKAAINDKKAKDKELLEDVKEQKSWYKNPQKLKQEKSDSYLGFRGVQTETRRSDPVANQTSVASPPPVVSEEFEAERSAAGNDGNHSNLVISGNQNTYQWTPSSVAYTTVAGSTSSFASAGSYSLTVTDMNGVTAVNTTSSQQEPNAHVYIRPWDSKEPYMKSLRKAKTSELYTTYLSLRPNYADQPSFFIDVYEVMKQRKRWKEAMRVISNLAEMELENQSLLRILAQAMLRAKRYEQALFIYRKLVELRGEEPQSYRDLGLALEENGLHNEAIKQLYKAATMVSDSRFRGIQLIALNEINHILNRFSLKTKILKPAFLYPFKVDIRVVLNWDADNTDVDLWVIDPFGEKCFYSHKLTEIGGRISNDFTGGYGPEEFLLRHAVPGEYKIMAHYYGDHSTTAVEGKLNLTVQLFKFYGSKFEKRIELSRRLSQPNSVVEMGTFSFEK